MLGKTSKVAGSQIDLKPVKIEAPKIMHRPNLAPIGSKSQRVLELGNQFMDST